MDFSTILNIECPRSLADYDNYIEVIKKEAQNVQKTITQKHGIYLRMIDSSVGIKIPHGLSSCLPVHQAIVFQCILFALFVQSGGSFNPPPSLQPLWAKLFVRSKGLRKITPEFTAASEILLNAFGIVPALKFGREDQKVTLSTEIDPALISAAKFASQKAQKIRQFPSDDFDLHEIEQIVSHAKSTDLSNESVKKLVSTLNGLNLIYLKKGNIYQLEKNLTYLVNELFPKIVDPDEQQHIYGNFAFQMAIISGAAGRVDLEKRWLTASLESDQGFTTAYYKLAQLLHDELDRRADALYQMAIVTSPFDFSVGNDYGIFLKEMSLENEFESWKNLFMIVHADTKE